MKCNNELHKHGLPMPRTCAKCGLGACTEYEPFDSLPTYSECNPPNPSNDDEMVRVTLILTRGGDIRTDVIAAGQVEPPSINTLVAGMAARLLHGFASDDIVNFQRVAK